MSEWKAWCRGHEDLAVQGDMIEVRLQDQRVHRVTVTPAAGGLTLTARVATRAAMAEHDDRELLVWRRNRVTQLVGFRFDKHDLLVGECHLPAAGLTADEFLFTIRHLAAECDRFEALLTGADTE